MGNLAINGGTKVREQPFHPWPVYDERDDQVLKEVLGSRNWGGYPSPNTMAAKFAAAFADAHDAKYGICAANGTVTLEIALRAAGIKAGDEVIVTPLTWLATALAPVYINAVPVFADINPETYCLDPDAVEAAITDKTRAIIPVHLGCRIADMDALMEIAHRRDLIVIEDCAHVHGAKWEGKGVGSIGHFGSFSFQSSKLMTAGEGGMVLTNDKLFEEKCQSLVNCGRKETGYNTFEGNLNGWNYRITEWQAALLLVGLERLPEQTRVREENVAHLLELISGIEGIRPVTRDKRITTAAYYQLILRYDPEAFGGVTRDQFVAALNAEGVPCDGYFYIPIYQNPLFAVYGDEYPMCRPYFGDSVDPSRFSCPNAEKAAYQEAVWFHHPLFMGEKKDVEDIAEAIKKVVENIDELK